MDDAELAAFNGCVMGRLTYGQYMAMPEAELAALIGCESAQWELFEHGAQLGVMAYWSGGHRHAVPEQCSGRRPHPQQSDWTEVFPTLEDFQRAAMRLRHWHEARVAMDL